MICHSQKTQQKGFAIVIALSLMAFVLLLLLSITTLTQTEIRAARINKEQLSARQNALLALNIALGQLQAAAGPDQRITARAEILDTGSTTLRNTVVKQPLWAGVWKTGSEGLDTVSIGTPQRQTSFQASSTTPTITEKVASATWLVSNPTPTIPLDPTSYAGTTTGANPTAVTLAKALGTNAIDVTAPLVPISAGMNGTGAGRYAYWVSDEGVKAKVNLKDPTYGVNPSTSFVQNQLHFLVPQAVPVNTGLLGADNTTDIRDQASLNKVMGLPSLEFVTGVTLPGNTSTIYSPDATTASYGVIADVKNGGLKTDLSAVFEDTTQYKAFLKAKESTDPARVDAPGDAKLFTVAGSANTALGNSTSPIVYGPRWQQFYNYYSLYKDAIPANGLNNTPCTFDGLNKFSGGNPGTATPTIDMRAYNYSSIPENTGAPLACQGEYYMPRYMGAGIYLSLSSEQVPTPTGQPAPAPGQNYYKLRLYAKPQVVYYNPYNVTLNGPVTSGTSEFQLNWASNVLTSLRFTVKVGTTTVLNNKIMYGREYKEDLTWTTDTDPDKCDLTFAPGQLRVFGLKTLTQVDDRSILHFAGPKDGTNNAYLGSDVGQSQWCYLTNDKDANDTTQPGKSPTDDWVGLVNDNDVVNISVASHKFRTNNGRHSTLLSPASLNWPQSGNSKLFLGRLNFDDATANAAQTVTLPAISNIQSQTEGTPFCYFVARSKGIQQSRTGATGPLVTGAMPVFSSSDGNISPYPYFYQSPSMDIEFELAQNPTSATDVQVIGNSPSLDTFWGLHSVARNSSDNNGFVMADIPRQPLLSLGQFMHMAMRNSMATQIHYEVDQNSSLMPIGGSLCNPFITLDKSYVTFGSGSSLAFVMDDNYMSNDALFDSYFFSSVPPALPDADYKDIFPALTAASGTGVFDDANIKANTVTLPNARMTFYAKDGVAPQKTDSSKNNYLPDYKKCAANLLLDGAFNVNSTSVTAWASLLSSQSGNVLNYLSNGTFSPANLNGKIPILRHASVVSADGTNPVNTPFGGVHALSQNQITELATAIVTQVKTRGPFLSMADFINRRLDANTDVSTGLGFKGALQAAIDATTINSTNIGNIGMPSGDVVTGGTVPGPLPDNKLYPNQVPDNTAIGIPGWLMQQDLVQAFSAVMTVRSDTFIIRTYGEVLNPATSNATPVAKAWCEAVVQRVPDYVDQTDFALTDGDATPVANLTADSTNQNYGRRFKVVSLRWIQNETDI